MGSFYELDRAEGCQWRRLLWLPVCGLCAVRRLLLFTGVNCVDLVPPAGAEP